MATIQSAIRHAPQPTETICTEAVVMWESQVAPDLDEATRQNFEPLFGALVSRLKGKVESEQGYSPQGTPSPR
jgi:hypothetical protein